MRPLARGLRNQFLLSLFLGSEGSKIVIPLSLLLLTWTPLPCWLWKEWKAASYLPSWCPTPQPTSTEENTWLIFPDSLRTLPTGKEDFSLVGIPSQSSFFFAHRKKKKLVPRIIKGIKYLHLIWQRKFHCVSPGNFINEAKTVSLSLQRMTGETSEPRDYSSEGKESLTGLPSLFVSFL